MNKPALSNVQHKCTACDSRRESYFCNLSNDALKAFERIKVTSGHPDRSVIFSQGQPSQGVYILCSGRVKLSTFSKDGKNLILRIAAPGEVLGLSSCLSDKAHHATAEAVSACQINFVGKKEFMRFLREFPEAEHNLVRQLNNNYSRACEQIRSLALAHSSAEKLARLFVTLLNGQKNGRIAATIELRLTHEEIGSMINASRETVTRLLKEFRQSGLISITGSHITVNDIPRLSRMADERVVTTEEV
jgi:CRP/FNR family transcriptional regulator